MNNMMMIIMMTTTSFPCVYKVHLLLCITGENHRFKLLIANERLIQVRLSQKTTINNIC